MNIIQFPIICALCNKKSSKKEAWLVFNKYIADYEEKNICAICAEEELKKIVDCY